MRNGRELVATAAAMALVVAATLACKGGAGSADGGEAGAAASASAVVTASATASSAPPTAKSLASDPMVAGLLKSLSKAAECDKKGSLDHEWCVVDALDSGERDGTLDDQGFLMGVSIELKDGDATVKTAMLGHAKLAVLAIDKRSGERFAQWSTLDDSDDPDDDVREDLYEILRGPKFSFEKASVPSKLWSKANGLSAKATSKLVALPKGWHYESPTTDVTKVDKTFVAIELTSPKSIRVGIFTDKLSEKH